MKSAADVTAALTRRLESCWADPTARPWPLRIGLGLPGKDALEADFAAVRDWAWGWQQWAQSRPVDLLTVTRRVHGTTQELPTAVVVADADMAAAVLGHGWRARLDTAAERRGQVAARFPEADSAAVVRAAEPLGDVDFALLLAAGHWFATHDATGLTARQVPVPGLHAKWLDRHGALVAALIGSEGLGLVERPPLVRFTYLDPGYRAGSGRHHDTVTGDEAARVVLPYRPKLILVVENLDSMLFFPPVPGAIAVWGTGRAATVQVARLTWVRDCARVVYWGDIDADGFEILDHLRSSGLQAESLLMDATTLNAYTEFGTWATPSGAPVTAGRRKDLTHLTAAEFEVYVAITDPDWTGPRRLEQERIPLPLAASLLNP